MKDSDVLIAHNAGEYKIKIMGRANFEYAPPLRNLAKSLESEPFKKISVDLSACTFMDSTFMGILAMLGLRAKKKKAEMEVVNAGETNVALLRGLGLKKLFSYTEKEKITDEKMNWRKAGKRADMLSNAKTVLDAHDTLMDVTPENVQKFKAVVEFAKKDLEKLKE